MSNTFDDLFIEEDEFNEELLKEILDNKVKLTNEGRVIFQEEFSAKHKIILYLLSNKIFVKKGIKADESEGPRDIYKNSDIPEGTVKRTVRELTDDKIVMTKDGKYQIPNYGIIKIKKMFQNDK